MRHQVVAERDGRAENSQQPLACGTGPPQRRDQGRQLLAQFVVIGGRADPGTQGLHEPHERQEGQIRVGDMSQRLDDPVIEGLVQGVDQASESRIGRETGGLAGIGEPEPSEGGARAFDPRH